MDSFYKYEELNALGFKSVGSNVLISKKASIYSSDKIELGNNIRIDDFCILSGEIKLGNYIHIAAYSALYGGTEGIFIDDFSNISSKVSIYALSDDYSGESMTNPMVPDEYKNLIYEKVTIGKHCILGCGCIVLPGVNIGEGSAFGAFSFINSNSKEWSINVGIPFKQIKNRSKNVLLLEKKMKDNLNLLI